MGLSPLDQLLGIFSAVVKLLQFLNINIKSRKPQSFSHITKARDINSNPSEKFPVKRGLSGKDNMNHCKKEFLYAVKEI